MICASLKRGMSRACRRHVEVADGEHLGFSVLVRFQGHEAHGQINRPLGLALGQSILPRVVQGAPAVALGALPLLFAGLVEDPDAVACVEAAMVSLWPFTIWPMVSPRTLAAADTATGSLGFILAVAPDHLEDLAFEGAAETGLLAEEDLAAIGKVADPEIPVGVIDDPPEGLPVPLERKRGQALRVKVRLVTMISGMPLPLMSATSTPMLTPLMSARIR